MVPTGHLSKPPINRTSRAVQRQVTAMSADLFEIGLYNPDAVPKESVMIPRVWDAEAILNSTPWLRHQNRDGRNIYVRPKGEHHLSLVDDLTKDAVSAMKSAGFDPAVIVETSPGNFQAWLKHIERLARKSALRQREPWRRNSAVIEMQQTGATLEGLRDSRIGKRNTWTSALGCTRLCG